MRLSLRCKLLVRGQNDAIECSRMPLPSRPLLPRWGPGSAPAMRSGAGRPTGMRAATSRTLPPGPQTDLIRYGGELVRETRAISARVPPIRPSATPATISPARIGTSTAACKPFGVAAGVDVRDRSDDGRRARDVACERINGCMTRSMNGSRCPTTAARWRHGRLSSSSSAARRRRACGSRAWD